MKNKIYAILAVCALMCSSCEDWLSQEDNTAMSTEQVYSSVESISSIAANLYSRLPIYQDLTRADGSGLMDVARWDECTQGSSYWDQAGNVDRNYRVGDYAGKYGLIREINIHIRELTNSVSNISAEQQKYFLAEARFLRAMAYFDLVSILGGVPIIEEVFEYTENTIELARPRNKEAEVYDYIASEMDAIMEDLAIASPNLKSRATRGSALALKCRAMLYAGSIAYRSDENQAKGLILASGAVGIPKERANEYFQKCIDAYLELKKLGYSLYKADADLANNYAAIFQASKGNAEVIFSRDYDGTTFKNYYTTKVICAAMHAGLKTGCELNPTLNQVDAYEKFSTKAVEPVNPYNGQVQIESMADGTSNLSYKVYDNAADIFADRDPRLAGSILTPGSTFRGASVDFQAGLAIKNPNGSYTFKTLDGMENYLADANYYNGERITGIEGPHRVSGYISHTGFLMRKYVDVKTGSEAEGNSAVPQIVFRLGESVLNAAEAAYCLSENGVDAYADRNTRELALELINEIRERAGGASFRITDSELDMNRIMNERRVELAYEDHRYYDLKRWRKADEVWAYDPTNETSVMKGLWPYKIYDPGKADHGKWIFRKVLLQHRGSLSYNGQPLNFDRTMYYSAYPQTAGNPYIEKNPNH